MGCNTSKESVQPAVDEAKEGDSVKNGGESLAVSYINPRAAWASNPAVSSNPARVAESHFSLLFLSSHFFFSSFFLFFFRLFETCMLHPAS